MQKLLNNKRIQTFGYSMYPLLHDKDIVYFEEVLFEKIKVNDIVIAQNEEVFVTHRVIYKGNHFVITKGDNNTKSDPKVQKQHIIGRLTHVVRNHRKINPENLYLIQSAYYFKEIVNLQKLLIKNHIPYICLKGLPLHLYYQKNTPRRIFADCDFLIKRRDMPLFSSLISRVGYQKVDKTFIKNNDEVLKEISFYKVVNNYGIVFDVHVEPVFMMTKVRNSFFYPEELLDEMSEAFFRKSHAKTINGYKMPLLSGEHVAMYLALHFFHHNFKENFRLELIDTVIRQESIKRKDFWNNLSKDIQYYKIANFIFPVFLILKKYYQTPIDSSFLKKIKPQGFLPHILSQFVVQDSIFNGQRRLVGGIQRFFYLLLLSPESWNKKIQYAFNANVLFLTIKSITTYIKTKSFRVHKKRNGHYS